MASHKRSTQLTKLRLNTAGLGTSSSYGSDGLIYEQGGDDAVIAGNTLRNFRFEGIQANPTRLTITGNNFSSVASPSCTAVEITPNAVWEATNVQITVSGNVASGVLTFVNTGSLTSDNAPQIDCVIANNSVKLGNRDAGLSGLGIILCRGNRVAIRGNTFDNYATAAMIIGGDGLSDSSLNIEGNVLTTVATNFMNAGLWLNYYNGSTPFNAGFRNLIIQNNTINSGNGGAHIFMYANNFSTNTPGRVILGNNIYVTGANTNGYKWVGAQNKSYSNIILHPGTTNWGNYVITDLGPDY